MTTPIPRFQSGNRAVSGDQLNALVDAINALKVINNPAAAYTFGMTDAVDTYQNFTSGSAVAVTVPNSQNVPFPIGTQINFEQGGAGQITVAGDSGVTVNATPGLKSSAQFAVMCLVKKALNIWTLTGSLSA